MNLDIQVGVFLIIVAIAWVAISLVLMGKKDKNSQK